MASLSKLTIGAALTFTSLLVLLTRPAAAQTASVLFEQVKADAKTQHKHILMVFSASWCGPCKLYERFLEDSQMKPITEKAFVVQRIDVGERPSDAKHVDTPGGVDLRSALGSKGEPGFPFIVMTDENGTPLANSFRDGDTNNNIGYPAVPKEFDWYIEMLKRAAPALSSADLAATRLWLQKHSSH